MRVYANTDMERVSGMPLRTGIAAWSMLVVCAGLAACTTDGTSGAHASFMAKCVETAKTEQERSECAWKNADRMASGN